jgi:two-component system cell cycle response regulator
MAEAIARRVSVESTTRGLLADLSTTVELEGVSDRILASLCRICSAKAGVLYANTGNRLELLSCSGVDRSDDLPESIDATQGLAERALSTGEIVHVSPSKDGFEWVRMSSPLGAFLPESIALVPLMAEQRPAGLAVLASPESDMSGASRQLADAIRHQAAPYLGNAVLHRKLEDLAAIDELTHVLNRRFGMRRLSEEFSRATRHGTPLSLVMLDIDHFKVFNDTFGHDAGDAVLVAVASIIEKSLRAGDLVCRYGGEEFLVVAPGMGLSDAGGAAERLRRTVETTPIEWRDQSLHVTVSLGAAAWPVAHVSVPEELVTCADEALYHSKNSGRDRVSLHQGDSVIPLSVLQPEARG